jgi:hypothetical protein
VIASGSEGSTEEDDEGCGVGVAEEETSGSATDAGWT